MTTRREVIDELLTDDEHPQNMLGEGGLLKELRHRRDRTSEQETELDMHLNYPKHGREAQRDRQPA